MAEVKQLQLTQFEQYFYNKYRYILLHLIGRDYNDYAKRMNLNVEACMNFKKYEHEDYNAIRGKKPKRYLTVINCVRILEQSGYVVEVDVKMVD